MVAITVAGAAGRMGRLLVGQILEASDLRLAGALEGPRHPELGSDAGSLVGRPTGVRLTADVASALAHAQVVVDFSAPDATAAVVRAAAGAGVACVVGTTGLPDDARAAVAEAAARVPVVAAPNMSVGVQVLGHLVSEALKLLGPGFDVEVLEMHHARKVDAPSGTAQRLVELVAEARGGSAGEDARHGRRGAVGPRGAGEIGVHAVRAGDIVGDHTVLFAGAGERLELTHRAHSREVFAAGALRAARWVVGRPAGAYSMVDVLGLPGARG